MTHSEIIAKMDDFNIGLSNGFGDAKTLVHFVNALRAVVELHKPEEFENGPDDYKLVCSHCQLGVIGEAYPCETIQAIEKELV